MNEKEIIELSLTFGFDKAKIIDTDEIVFDLGFRKYCEEDRCGNYCRNYSCPPDCGTPMKMKEEVLKYKKALILQSCWQIDDLTDKDILKTAKALHNRWMLRLINALKANGFRGLMAGASECMVCDQCEKIKGNECKFPELKFSCLSAYCVNVMELARECSMDYTYKNGRLSFFGAYFFDDISEGNNVCL